MPEIIGFSLSNDCSFVDYAKCDALRRGYSGYQFFEKMALLTEQGILCPQLVYWSVWYGGVL